MDFRLAIAQEILKALGETNLTAQEIADMLEVPPDSKLGDYAFPCFKLSKVLRKSPMMIADGLASAVRADFLSRVESVKGYLNFFIDRAIYAEKVLRRAEAEGERYGSDKSGEGKCVVLDYSSINIAKRFHIGHLSTTMIGNSLYKLYKFFGWKAVGVNHLGDWGTQFGKMIAAYKRWGDRETVEKGGVDEMVKLYVRFHKEAEKDPALEDEGRHWFKLIEDGDPEALSIFNWFKEVTLKDAEKTYALLGVTFDSYAGESFYNDKMGPIVDALREKGLLKEDKGAMIVDLEPYGMPPALILRSDGASLYITRDLAAAKYRKDTYNFDKSLYVVAYQQDLHFKQLFKVLELMGYEWAKDCEHVSFGMVSFEGQTLSTREGRVVYLDDLLKTAIEKARAIIDEKSPNLENKDEISRQIGVGAVVFFALYNNRIKDIDFWWDRALNFEGETGPYVMYTHARSCSVLRKAGECAAEPSFEALSDPEAQEVVRLIEQYPLILKSALERSEPSMITRFSADLAQAFNRFYFERRILDDDMGARAARLLLTRICRDVIKSALGLIGLSAPERM
ncbi:MAG TPA: arginine--tRNA ligase [Candidatus Pullichristensenella excrementigallinarum]|uniref:Arginine--tRNA ligase n=1 Tax=Candidatus Pullichristensenella excrementigallinarum TaxID=2840907 RepID=A0A9D1IAA9_9FIRM|nr:arginine--tRNA ligase [Candidatus Pullichristensenella excrementigallinarum]